MSKPEVLIKIGIEVVEFESRVTSIFILDKYQMSTGGQFENWITHQIIENNINEFERILEEMRIHAKEIYGLKLNKKLAKFS